MNDALQSAIVGVPESVSLADAFTLTLNISGPAPLVVIVPQTLLSPGAAQSWLAQPIDMPTTREDTLNQSVWSLKIRLEPLSAGEKIPLQFNTFQVVAGGATMRECSFGLREIEVRTVIGELPTAEARPITGIEKQPPSVAEGDSRFAVVVLISLLILCGTVGFIMRMRWRQRASIMLPRKVPLDQLRQWFDDPNCEQNQCASVALIAVRIHFATRFQRETTHMTAAELLTLVQTDAPELVPTAKQFFADTERIVFGNERLSADECSRYLKAYETLLTPPDPT